MGGRSAYGACGSYTAKDEKLTSQLWGAGDTVIDRCWWFRQMSSTQEDGLQEITWGMGLAGGPWLPRVWDVGGTLGRLSMLGCPARRQSR